MRNIFDERKLDDREMQSKAPSHSESVTRHKYVPLNGDVGTWCGHTEGAMTCSLSATAEVHQVDEANGTVAPSTAITKDSSLKADSPERIWIDPLLTPVDDKPTFPEYVEYVRADLEGDPWPADVELANALERCARETGLSLQVQICPNCANVGYYATGPTDSPEQVQCEFCETTPNSLFKIKEAIRAAIEQPSTSGVLANPDRGISAGNEPESSSSESSNLSVSSSPNILPCPNGTPICPVHGPRYEVYCDLCVESSSATPNDLISRSAVVARLRERIALAEEALPCKSEKVDAAVRMKLGELRALADEVSAMASATPETSDGACNCGLTRHMRGANTHDTRCQKYDAEKEGMRLLLAAVITDLPSSRDWLDPELEKEMRAAVGYTDQFNARQL